MRPSNRKPDQMREVTVERGFSRHAEGSCLIKFGNTHVLCTASLEERIPPWLRGKGEGWVTAEYGMLPGATSSRNRREASAGKQGGRTVEIQRLIGRSLRAAIDLNALGEHTITIDCDVIQADGGTRTASISGGFVALSDSIAGLQKKGTLKKNPLYGSLAAISVGIYEGNAVLDLDYAEDSAAETDMNVVMNDAGSFIEIQGTAEGHAFRRSELDSMLELAESGIADIIRLQQAALASDSGK